jgi:hypothetical protein
LATVLRFPNKSLVAVLVRPDGYWIMLTKIGAKDAALQVAYPTLGGAVRERRGSAALCGWRYVGVSDEERLRALGDWRRQTGRGDAA